MFVFHQQMNFLTFLVCIWLWAALLSSRGSAMPVALCQVLELLCRCDLKEMVLHIPAVSTAEMSLLSELECLIWNLGNDPNWTHQYMKKKKQFSHFLSCRHLQKEPMDTNVTFALTVMKPSVKLLPWKFTARVTQVKCCGAAVSHRLWLSDLSHLQLL